MKSDFKKRKINLLDEAWKEEDQSNQSYKTRPIKKVKAKKSSGKRKKFSCFFIILIILFLVISTTLSKDNDSFLGGVKNSYLIRQITNIISPAEKYLQGEKEDRINFILMGMGGAGHNGPYLTDTIIIASFKPSTKEAAMISLPRDMIVPLSSGNYRKINSIYTIGQQEDDTTGGELMKEVVGRTFNMEIHYFAAVDFNGFVEIVDAIGGVDVTVDRSFTDTQFPTYDYKYREVSFEKGEQEMDGTTALRFSRSRHGNNGEGSDFARIKRQQKVLLGIKDKITSFNTLINPKKITSLFSLFNQYTTTDIEPWEAVKLVHMGKDLNTTEIVHQSIDDRPGGYLSGGIAASGAYILQPVTGNFDQIELLIKNIFDIEHGILENSKIVVQNGTDVPGLALKAVNHLTQVGYNVLRYGNSDTQDKISTIIYTYTNDKSQTQRSLEAIFATKSTDNIPIEYSNSVITANWNILDDEDEYEQLDFLIILGSDQEIDEDREIITTIDPSLLASTTTSTIEIIEEEEEE
jgi:polyisoprenyl-teichoic acid--peptidoglycan teichoic acid transferase